MFSSNSADNPSENTLQQLSNPAREQEHAYILSIFTGWKKELEAKTTQTGITKIEIPKEQALPAIGDKRSLSEEVNPAKKNCLLPANQQPSLFKGEELVNLKITISKEGILFKFLNNFHLIPMYTKNIIKALGEKGLVSKSGIIIVDMRIKDKKGNDREFPVYYHGKISEEKILLKGEINKKGELFIYFYPILTVPYSTLKQFLESMRLPNYVQGMRILTAKFDDELAHHLGDNSLPYGGKPLPTLKSN